MHMLSVIGCVEVLMSDGQLNQMLESTFGGIIPILSWENILHNIICVLLCLLVK